MTIAEKIEKKKARLELYYTAEEQILGVAQSYTLGSRSLTRANLSEIKQMIDTLEDEIAELEGLEAGKRPRKAVAALS